MRRGGRAAPEPGRLAAELDREPPSLATELLNKSLLRRLSRAGSRARSTVSREPLEVESVIGACMFIRSECLAGVGGFDERFFFFLEETDFCRQVRARGWKVCHLPQARRLAWSGPKRPADSRQYRASSIGARATPIFGKNCGPLTCGLLRDRPVRAALL